MKSHTLDDLHEDVPGNYYDHAIVNNIFQKYWHTRRFSESKKILAGIKAKKILDVGCHGGRFTCEVAKMFPKASVYGVDISSPAIRFAKSKYPGMHFLVARAEKLPFPESTFDLVNCFEALEHIKDTRSVLKAIFRVLKPGGNIVILVPTENLLFRIIWYFWTHFGPGKVWRHTHVWQFKDHLLDEFLIKEGFKIRQRKIFLLGMLSFTHAKKLRDRS